MEYYDIKANWRKLKRHIAHPDVQAVLVRDFNKFTFGRWREVFHPGMLPRHFESCDWERTIGRRGRHPAYWAYVKHSACHWLCNFQLVLAMRAEPKRPWRILTSDKHSTVFDGDDTLFDFNFSAMCEPPNDCFSLAFNEIYPPGMQMKVAFAAHYTFE